MRQQQFEQQHQQLWDELTLLLEDRKHQLDQVAHNRLPWLYRQVCNHYALAQERAYSPTLTTRLHHLVLQGHRQLYRRQSFWFWQLLFFISTVFPLTVRRCWPYVALSAVLFWLPAFFVGGYAAVQTELIYSILDEDRIADLETMYDPSNRKPGRTSERSSETDVAMFGYYISHNIGIGFQMFAGGLLLGLGTLFFLIYNGVVLGGVAGYLTQLGYHQTFWPFVSGHGAFELTAIVLCGAAGLMLAHALLAPGQRKRTVALRHQASIAIQIVMGATVMLVFAAFIEAFWSSGTQSALIKYSVAAGLWLLVFSYLGFAGRQHSES